MEQKKYITDTFSTITQNIDGNGNVANITYAPFELKSITYHLHIDAILTKAITQVDKIVNTFDYLDDEPDCDQTPSIEIDIEPFSYFDIIIYIRIRQTNTDTFIEDVFISDQNDNQFQMLAGLLEQKLCRFYKLDCKNQATTYIQELGIRSDRMESFGLSTKDNTAYVYQDMLLSAFKLSNDKEVEIKLKKIFAGKILSNPIKKKKETSCTDVTNTFIPFIDSNIFSQANKKSSNKEKAIFLKNCFSGSLLNYERAINKYYFAI